MAGNSIVDKFILSEQEKPLYLIYQELENQPTEVSDMSRICLACEQEKNQCTAMEYLYTNGLYQELRQLLDKVKHTDSEFVSKAAKFYELMYQRKVLRKKQLKPDGPAKYLKKLSRMKVHPDDYLIMLLSDLIHIYCYFDMYQYGMIGSFNENIKRNIHKVKDPLLYKLLNLRLQETLFIYHWKRNELILSRKYGYQLLQSINNPRKKIDIHNILAQGYIYESYDQAITHVNTAIEIAKEMNNARAVYGLKNYTLVFISAYHGKTEGIETEDKAEQAHLALANNQLDLCIETLESFESLTPFQMYYLGKAKRDKQLLRTSYQRFINERDDYFYAKLPLEALKTMD
ncbi:AimR family lysis-lysogeny pheromone receptor [Gracilibacillus alcaliphilus]|uniref:AimR family lysis-lysogeny pheromone receptor n=1 Tax=Gracilibacillus alcaliphilus TaxID=1401441 RepID=UPI001956D86A|nr:AimR family lysis-lysogeny pheromone receptor [Gracilibacillus alcaliphilus]MBM7677239.1 putative AlkP superfamily pyrophosphatase or phosphodiesterase [Gracilibacillus alcaliphilus]